MGWRQAPNKLESASSSSTTLKFLGHGLHGGLQPLSPVAELRKVVPPRQAKVLLRGTCRLASNQVCNPKIGCELQCLQRTHSMLHQSVTFHEEARDLKIQYSLRKLVHKHSE